MPVLALESHVSLNGPRRREHAEFGAPNAICCVGVADLCRFGRPGLGQRTSSARRRYDDSGPGGFPSFRAPGRCDLVEIASRILCREVHAPRGFCVGDRRPRSPSNRSILDASRNTYGNLGQAAVTHGQRTLSFVKKGESHRGKRSRRLLLSENSRFGLLDTFPAGLFSTGTR